MRLHDLRWGDRSSLPEGPRRAVIADFSEAAARRGWLRLWLLVADGEPVAAELAWRVGDRQVHYQGGFDPEWAARGVGVTAMMHAIQAEWDAGVREFDLCQGLADYKVRYSTGIAEAESLRLVRRTSPARIGAEARHLARDVVAPRLPERLRGFLSALRRARS
jgi:CelD/BcsL family acetyltransferase involved in cellulose biosynthesis